MQITEDKELVYEFTTNPDLLDQYTKLRQSLYPTDDKFKGFRTFGYLPEEDYKKEQGKMLIVRKGNVVVGGAGLVISSPNERALLPLEQNILPINGRQFLLRRQFPNMRLENYSYGEFNRIVLLPEYRTGIYTKTIFKKMLIESERLGLRYLFGMGDRVRARLYKKLYGNFGLNVNICWDIDVPQKDDYENIKMYIMTMDLKDLDIHPMPVAQAAYEEHMAV